MDIKALVALAIALLLPALLIFFQPDARPDSAERYVIEVRDAEFDPPGLFVEPGAVVAWVWPERTRTPHTTTAYHPVHDRPLRIPLGVGPWDSGDLREAGSAFELALHEPGVYDYFCRHHESAGMVGRIIVRDPSGPALQSGNALPAQVGGRLLSVETIMGREGRLYAMSARLNAVAQLSRQDRHGTAGDALARLRANYPRGVLAGVNLGDEAERLLDALGVALASRDGGQVIALLRQLRTVLARAHDRLG